jgi:uncharacterized protein YneF (UPF0154 family)
MNNQKCPSCNCVNWISATQCVRCRQSLTNLPINNISADNEYLINSNYSDSSDKNVNMNLKFGLSLLKILGVFLVFFIGFYIVGTFLVYDQVSKVTMFQQVYYGVAPPSDEAIRKEISVYLPKTPAEKTVVYTPATNLDKHIYYENGQAKMDAFGQSIQMSEEKFGTSYIESKMEVTAKLDSFKILSAKIEALDTLSDKENRLRAMFGQPPFTPSESELNRMVAEDSDIIALKKKIGENPKLNHKFIRYTANYSCTFSLDGKPSTQNGIIVIEM